VTLTTHPRLVPRS